MEIIKNVIKCKNVETRLKVKQYMIFVFASVVPLLLMEDMIIYADVGTVKIGKKCL